MLVRRLPGQRGSEAAAKATSPSIKMFTKTTGDFRMANMAREGPHGQKRPSGPPWPHVVNVAMEGHRASGHVNFSKHPVPLVPSHPDSRRMDDANVAYDKATCTTIKMFTILVPGNWGTA